MNKKTTVDMQAQPKPYIVDYSRVDITDVGRSRARISAPAVWVSTNARTGQSIAGFGQVENTVALSEDMPMTFPECMGGICAVRWRYLDEAEGEVREQIGAGSRDDAGEHECALMRRALTRTRRMDTDEPWHAISFCAGGVRAADGASIDISERLRALMRGRCVSDPAQAPASPARTDAREHGYLLAHAPEVSETGAHECTCVACGQAFRARVSGALYCCASHRYWWRDNVIRPAKRAGIGQDERVRELLARREAEAVRPKAEAFEHKTMAEIDRKEAEAGLEGAFEHRKTVKSDQKKAANALKEAKSEPIKEPAASTEPKQSLHKAQAELAALDAKRADLMAELCCLDEMRSELMRQMIDLIAG